MDLTYSQILVLIFASGATGAMLTWLWFALGNKLPEAPRIIVYLDKDAQQPLQLPIPNGKALTGERAALWWTVFNREMNDVYASSDDAAEHATEAVETVYGVAR